MPVLTSRHNPLVSQFRAIAESPAEVILLDGPHLLEEALGAAVPVEIVAVVDDAREDLARLAARAETAGARVIAVTANVLAAMSPVRQPSGIVALARRVERSLGDVLAAAPQMVLMLDEVQDPGNVGAIVRAADACGATGVVAGRGTADPMGWKALRGSMGSVFRVPTAVRQSLPEAVQAARGKGMLVFAAVPRDGVALPECDLRRPLAVLLGGEGAGLGADLVAMATDRLTIPMRPPVESLNVAAAAALIAYEAQRQRASFPS